MAKRDTTHVGPSRVRIGEGEEESRFLLNSEPDLGAITRVRLNDGGDGIWRKVRVVAIEEHPDRVVYVLSWA